MGKSWLSICLSKTDEQSHIWRKCTAWVVEVPEEVHCASLLWPGRAQGLMLRGVVVGWLAAGRGSCLWGTQTEKAACRLPSAVDPWTFILPAAGGIAHPRHRHSPMNPSDHTLWLGAHQFTLLLDFALLGPLMHLLAQGLPRGGLSLWDCVPAQE